MTHDEKLVEAVAIALCPEDYCCECPDECPLGWDFPPTARAALDAINAAGYEIRPRAQKPVALRCPKCGSDNYRAEGFCFGSETKMGRFTCLSCGFVTDPTAAKEQP